MCCVGPKVRSRHSEKAGTLEVAATLGALPSN